VYKLLFRSRWYALAWAVFMAASAVVFTTTGAGAWITSGKLEARAAREARENEFRAWAEDDKRRMDDETGFDPSNPEHVRDGTPPRHDAGTANGQSAPFTRDEADEDLEDEPDSQ
jgi:hypothetical protein